MSQELGRRSKLNKKWQNILWSCPFFVLKVISHFDLSCLGNTTLIFVLIRFQKMWSIFTDKRKHQDTGYRSANRLRPVSATNGKPDRAKKLQCAVVLIYNSFLEVG